MPSSGAIGTDSFPTDKLFKKPLGDLLLGFENIPGSLANCVQNFSTLSPFFKLINSCLITESETEYIGLFLSLTRGIPLIVEAYFVNINLESLLSSDLETIPASLKALKNTSVDNLAPPPLDITDANKMFGAIPSPANVVFNLFVFNLSPILVTTDPPKNPWVPFGSRCVNLVVTALHSFPIVS